VFFGNVEDDAAGHKFLEAFELDRDRILARRKVCDVEIPGATRRHSTNISAGVFAVNYEGRVRYQGAAGIRHSTGERGGQLLRQASG